MEVLACSVNINVYVYMCNWIQNNTFTYQMIYSQWTSLLTLRAREDQIPLLSMMFLSPRHYLRGTCHYGEKPLWQVGQWTHDHLSPPRTHESDLFGKLVFCRQNDDNDLVIRLPCTGRCISPCLQPQPLGRQRKQVKSKASMSY